MSHDARSRFEPPPPGRPPAPWVTITGGKGGVGKTLIATNLAVSIARAGYRTLLVDLDPGLANVDVHLRMAPRYNLEDLADGACAPAEAILPAAGGVSVLCGCSGSPRLADDPRFVETALDAVLDAAADFDVVICDTGAGIGRAVVEAARRSRQVIAVTTPEPAAVTDTYALCKLFVARGITVPRLLINRVRSRDEAMRTAGRLATVGARFLDTRLHLLGWLRQDPGLAESVRNQRAFALHGTGPAMEDLRAITATTLSDLPDLLRRGKGSRHRDLQRLGGS